MHGIERRGELGAVLLGTDLDCTGLERPAEVLLADRSGDYRPKLVVNQRITLSPVIGDESNEGQPVPGLVRLLLKTWWYRRPVATVGLRLVPPLFENSDIAGLQLLIAENCKYRCVPGSYSIVPWCQHYRDSDRFITTRLIKRGCPLVMSKHRPPAKRLFMQLGELVADDVTKMQVGGSK